MIKGRMDDRVRFGRFPAQQVCVLDRAADCSRS